MTPSDFFSESHLREFFNRNILKKKGGGRDNLTPEKFLQRFPDEFVVISQRCLDGTYKFSSYNEKLLLKSKNKYPRVISIPTIRDRIVLGVLNEYLSTVFPDCVNHKVPNSLIKEVENYLKTNSNRPMLFLRTDFRDFYGTINIKLLMNMIRSRISDEYVLSLVYKAITTQTISGKASKEVQCKPKRGVPQGLSISNILASIYMYAFDQDFAQANAGLYIRYVDDILFLDVKSPTIKHQMLSEIRKRNLRLRLSVEKCKSGIVGVDTIDFIGYTITDKIFVRRKNVTNFMNRLADMVARCRAGWDNHHHRPLFIKEDKDYINYYIEEFNRVISGFKYGQHLYGWLSYFQALTDVSSLYGMDHVIQNRLLKNLPKEISSKLHLLVDTYFDIRRNGGNVLVTDYDKCVNVEHRRHFLAKQGRIDKDKPYTEEQINIFFEAYMEQIKNDAMQNVGNIS